MPQLGREARATSPRKALQNKRLKIGLALSGGPDSLALLTHSMLARHRGLTDHNFVSLTVDHGLRDGSAAEAQQVADRVEQTWNIPAHVLTWQKPDGLALRGLQRTARWVRYRLLAQAATDLGLDQVWIAHSLDDQLETHQMRLERGSSLYGLAGMSARFRLFGESFVRPALATSGSDLHGVLDDQPIKAIQDPTNLRRDTWRGAARARWGRGLAKAPHRQTLVDTLAGLQPWRQGLESEALQKPPSQQNESVELGPDQCRDPFVLAYWLGQSVSLLRQCEHPPGFDECLRLAKTLIEQSAKGASRHQHSLGGCVVRPSKSADGAKLWVLKLQEKPAHLDQMQAKGYFWRKLFTAQRELGQIDAFAWPPQPFAIAQPNFVTTLR